MRNLSDGRVETVVEGSDDAIDRYLAELRKGPHGSRVTDVAVEKGPPGNFESFEITR